MKTLDEFENFYDASLRPELDGKKKISFITPFDIALFCVCAVLWASAKVHLPDGVIIFLAILLFILMVLSWIYRLRNMPSIKQNLAFNEKIDRDVMAAAAGFFGLKYDTKASVSFYDMRDSLIISSENSGRPCYEDHVFYGDACGRLHEIIQLHFTKTVKTKNSTSYYVIRGTVGVYDFERPFEGTTVLFKNSVSKSFYYSQTAGFQKVVLEWNEFEEVFDLYSTSQLESRVVMMPDFMEAVYNFYKQFPDIDLTITFHKGKMMVMFEEPAEVVADDVQFKYCPSGDDFITFKHLYDRISFITQMPEKLDFKGFRKEYDYAEDERKRAECVAAETDPGFAERTEDPAAGAVADYYNDEADRISPIIQSIIDGDDNKLGDILSRGGAGVNDPFRPNGNTPLHIAVWDGNINAVKMLLAQEKIDTAARNNAGKTALDLAKEKGAADVIQLLETKS